MYEKETFRGAGSALTMVLSLLPTAAFANDGEQPAGDGSAVEDTIDESTADDSTADEGGADGGGAEIVNGGTAAVQAMTEVPEQTGEGGDREGQCLRIAIQWTENGPTEYFKITFAVTGIEPKVVTSTPVESPDIDPTPEPETPDDSSRNEKGDGDYTSDAAPAAPAAPVTPAAPETPAASEPATETVGDTTTKTEAEATFADGQVTFTTSQMGEYVIGTK